MRDAMEGLYGNPHSHEHAAGWAAADAIEQARAKVASSISADDDEIVFTSGATEANNIAILGACDHAKRRRVVVSAIEHKAVLGPARELRNRGYEVIEAPVKNSGVVDLEKISELIDERTSLVSCMAVNNEIGTVQPTREIAQMCQKVGAIFHVDAAQALGWGGVNLLSCQADLLSLSAHKAGGPKGVGALFVRREIRERLAPIFYGGEQEGGLRPGTLPTPLCVGFGEACAHLPTSGEVGQWRSRTLKFLDGLLISLPGLSVNGDGELRHPGAISAVLPRTDAETVVMRLQPDVAISRGSACTSGMPEPSHVLRAIGLDYAQCNRTVRIGIGRFTTDEELSFAFDALMSAVSDLEEVA